MIKQVLLPFPFNIGGNCITKRLRYSRLDSLINCGATRSRNTIIIITVLKMKTQRLKDINFSEHTPLVNGKARI